MELERRIGFVQCVMSPFIGPSYLLPSVSILCEPYFIPLLYQ